MHMSNTVRLHDGDRIKVRATGDNLPNLPNHAIEFGIGDAVVYLSAEQLTELRDKISAVLPAEPAES